MKELPKFLLADNTDFPEAVFVIHTDYPRFVINVVSEEVEWFEDFDEVDERALAEEVENLLQASLDFYERELNRYEE